MRIERVVLDTNVIISAMISLAGKPKRCVVWSIENCEVVTSQDLIEELREKLDSPRLARLCMPGEPDTTVEALAILTRIVTPAPIEPACRDPDDDLVLATAVAGMADVVVTGDQDLLVLDPFRGIRILTPAAFLDAVAASEAD